MMCYKCFKVVWAKWVTGPVENSCFQSARFALATCQTLYILAHFACAHANYTYKCYILTIKLTQVAIYVEKRHEKNHILLWFQPHKNVVIQSITEGLAEAPEKSRTFWVMLSEFLIRSKKPHQNRMLRTAAHCAHVLTLPIAIRCLCDGGIFTYARTSLERPMLTNFFAEVLLLLMKTIQSSISLES